MPAQLDPRVDAYIDAAAPFARPILREVRARIHRGCPDVVESMKWGAPAFSRRGLLGGVAAFRQHVAIRWWQSQALSEADPDLRAVVEATARICDPGDLPGRRAFQKTLRAAMACDDAGPVQRQRKKGPATLPVPADFLAALRADARAKASFDGFANSYRRDYVEWICEAKRDSTRRRRIEQAVAWLREGKRRNWRYERR